MANYWGDGDAWGEPQRGRQGGAGFLNTGMGMPGGYRTPSTGPPAPQINVYNRIENDHDQPYPPYPPTRASPRTSPARGYNRHSRLGDHLVEDLAELELERRQRSRSRGRSDAPAYDYRQAERLELERERIAAERLAAERLQAERLQADRLQAERMRDRQAAYTEFQLAQQAAALKDAQSKADWEREERRIKDELRYKYAKDEEIHRYEKQKLEDELKTKMLEREAEERRKKEAEKLKERLWEDEYQLKQREKKEKEKAEEQRIKDDLERRKRQEEEKEHAYELELAAKRKAKQEEDDRIILEYERKKQAEKDKKEAELKEAERILKEREEKKKREAKEAEEKFQEEMRHRLRDLGYTEKTIEIMVDKEKAEKFKTKVESRSEVINNVNTLNVWRPAQAPVYPKVHRDYLAVETLKYYDLPWEYDRDDPSYIIILRDMSKQETDILFEHTTRLRSGALLIEGSKKKPEYAFYRKRSKSRHGKDRVGILEFK